MVGFVSAVMPYTEMTSMRTLRVIYIMIMTNAGMLRQMEDDERLELISL
jgi:hypothetical protein